MSDMKRTMDMRHLLLGLSVLAFGAGCKGSDPAQANEVAPAVVLGPQDVATAQLGPIGSAVLVSGPLEPAERATLRAQVPGVATGLRVDRGTTVRRGQILAVIEAAGIRGQAAGAQAGIAAAQANAALARQRLEAARTLREAGAMSEIDYRTAVAAHEAAQAQVAQARAQAAQSGEAAARTVITSPIAGVVSARMIENGEAVSPGDELFTVVNPGTLELEGSIAVADAARVRVGQPVEFTLDAVPNERHRGSVARVDPTADPATRQVGVYVQLPNQGWRLVGGQFARGRILTGASATAVLVPETAVRETASGERELFVVMNGRAVRRVVTLGPRDDASGAVAIMSGVQAGERVIVAPTTDITDGIAVSLSGDRPQTGAPPAAPAAAKER
jgi:membrane fusion protein, multidrug efflux system